MSLHLKDQENRTELQQRLDAELRAKAAARHKQETEHPDGIDDSAYIENTKQTTSLAWVWLLIFLAVIAAFVVFVYRVNTV